MENPCTEREIEITRYAHGDVTAEEESRIAAHLKKCPDCRDFAEFIQSFIEIGKQPDQRPLTEPHPGPYLLRALEAEELEKDDSERLFAHLLRCNACRNEYLSLSGVTVPVRAESDIETAEMPPLSERVIVRSKALLYKLGERIIDLGTRYNPGIFIAGIRILEQAPAFAFRGGAPAQTPSKLLEATIDGFAYSVAVGIDPGGSPWCDVAGVTGQEGPTAVSFYSDDGEELLSSKTDEGGNGHFVVPRPAHELMLIKLQRQRAEKWIPIMLPPPKSVTA